VSGSPVFKIKSIIIWIEKNRDVHIFKNKGWDIKIKVSADTNPIIINQFSVLKNAGLTVKNIMIKK